MNFLTPGKYCLAISSAITFVSIAIAIVPSPRLSIEFTGGTRMEIAPENAGLSVDAVRTAITSFGAEYQGSIVNRTGEGRFAVRMKNVDATQQDALTQHIEAAIGPFDVTQFTTIGPTVGRTLKARAAIAIIVASIGIILYVAIAFRNVPRRLSPWKFGIVAVATLVHDVMVTVGVFTILSYTTDFEVDTLFVTALLTILGYSVNDTIIVFDRIRDNLFFEGRKDTLAETAETSLRQTWKRSCFTSGSTLIVLTSLFVLGSHTLQWFVLTLIVGIGLGTYSSIFVATPLLVWWSERTRTTR